MYCSNCGQEIYQNETQCRHCGRVTAPPVAPPPQAYAHYPQQPQYPLAPHGARIGAYLLDGLFASLFAIPAIVILVVVVMSAMRDGPEFEPNRAEIQTMLVGMNLVFLVALLPSLYYSFCKDGFKGGASWGKRICGLRVVHLETAQPCTKGRSVLRQILNFVNCYGVFTLVDIIMVFANSQHRRLGDLIAGTMVIPADVPTATPVYQAPALQHQAPPQHGQPVSPQPPPPQAGPPQAPPHL